MKLCRKNTLFFASTKHTANRPGQYFSCRRFAARFSKVRRRAAGLRQGFQSVARPPPVCSKVSRVLQGLPPVRGKVSESKKHTRTNSMKKTEKTRTFEPEFKQ